MLVPVEWLNDYTKVSADIDEFCDRMTMSGSNLEAIEYFGENIENVVVGKILKIERHPDGDKLRVCRVDAGHAKPLQIVCGASNIFEGAVVPVALHKSRIPGPLHGQPKVKDGVKITKGKLRGVESFGMICSASELGFDDKVVPVFHKDGIWLLPENLTPGADFVEAMGMKTAAVDFEITPNRSDCLSIIGMAREAAATFNTELKYPDTNCEENSYGRAEDFIEIEIKDPLLCRRYAGRIVTDVKIKQSPWWLQKRLMLAGMRPINNIVDITNFVMLEYGQPIHAFDIRQLDGNKIIVETAEEGEIFTTLDEVERTLTGEMLLIKDATKSVAVAGVMGGMNSEIKEDTTTILIESANFNRDSVRQTSKKLALRTEASSRFEKGIDPNLCGNAADRVCRLIEIIGAGKVTKGTVDVYPDIEKAKTVDVRVSRINKVLGIDVSRKFMEGIFTSLEMRVENADETGDVLKVTPPTVRQDLLEEVDFVEEVARMYGYDKMPVTLPRSNVEAEKSKERTLRDIARNTMCSLGVNEIQTYSFVSPGGVDDIRIDGDARERNFVRLINPLGEENSVMRTVLTPNMLEVLRRNYSRNIEQVSAFEIGNTFYANPENYNELPEERFSLCIGMYGGDADFFALKGIVLELLKVLGITSVDFETEEERRTYHPGRCARVLAGGECIGVMGEIHPDVADKYGIGAKVYICELKFEKIVRMANIEKTYKPLPKYPSASRDIALLVNADVQVGRLESIIRVNGGKILKEVRLFDVYRGKQVDENKKSVAFNLVYCDMEKTLTDEEVLKVHNKVLEALKRQAGATLREM